MVSTTSTKATPAASRTASKTAVRKASPKDTGKVVEPVAPVAQIETAERTPEPLVFTIPTVDVHLSSRRVAISRPSLPHLSSPADALAEVNRVAAGWGHAVADMPERIRRNIPQNETTLFYGGLAALAAVGLVGWPTAAAIGAGVWIAIRKRDTAAPAEPDAAEAAKADEQPVQPAV
jgi:hypothetical protein